MKGSGKSVLIVMTGMRNVMGVAIIQIVGGLMMLIPLSLAT